MRQNHIVLATIILLFTVATTEAKTFPFANLNDASRYWVEDTVLCDVEISTLSKNNITYLVAALPQKKWLMAELKANLIVYLWFGYVVTSETETFRTYKEMPVNNLPICTILELPYPKIT